MRTLVFVIGLFIVSTVYAGDYVCYDANGYIVEKYYSIDGNHSAASRSDCIEISRNKFNILNEMVKVEPSIIGKGDDKIISKTAKELSDEKKLKDDAITAKKLEYQAVIDDLKQVGLTNETIIYLLNSNR